MKKSYTINISIPVSVFWKFVVPGFIVFVSLSVFSGIFVVDRIIMPQFIGVNRDIVSVPSVVNMTYENGREALFRAGLKSTIIERDFDEIVPEGHIVRQFPETGADVKKGRVIQIIVSKGEEVGMVPEVTKLSERQARITLKKAGFTLGKVISEYSDEVTKDYVIEVHPEESTQVSREMPIDLVVSEGPKPTHAVMPNVIGEKLGTAKLKIKENGLQIGEISYKNNNSLAPGTVLSQSAAPGTDVAFENRINLIVSVSR